MNDAAAETAAWATTVYGWVMSKPVKNQSAEVSQTDVSVTARNEPIAGIAHRGKRRDRSASSLVVIAP